MGRQAGPNKYTPAVVSAIQTALLMGCSRASSAEAAGIDRSTLYAWLNDPDRLTFGYRLVQQDGPEGESLVRQVPEPVTTFREMVERTQAASKNRYISIISLVARGGQVKKRTTVTRRDGSVVVTEDLALPNWEAAAWRLERMDPEEFAPKKRAPDFSGLTDQELLDLLAANNADEDTDAAGMEAITGGDAPKQLTGPNEGNAGLDPGVG